MPPADTWTRGANRRCPPAGSGIDRSVTLTPDESRDCTSYCAVELRVVRERSALRLQIDPRRYGDESGCPLVVDLYRIDRVIDAVVVYTGTNGGTGTSAG